MEITIKNMVCPRCIASVKNIFQKFPIEIRHIELGKIVVNSSISDDSKKQIVAHLEEAGFEWIDDHKTQLIEQVKTLVIQAVHHTEQLTANWSTYLSDQLPYDYKYISHLFSEVHGITLEQFILKQKVEKVKELIRYDQMTLTQIAYQLNYSSVAHLSSQFKKITGMTPSQFKTSQAHRNSIDLL